MAETVSFFTTHLFSTSAVADFSRLTGLKTPQAEEALQRHLGVCVDACHAAVEFEDPDDVLSTLRDAGIRILKIQLSAGLRISCLDRDTLTALQPFAESTYLHQVVERIGSELIRYVDLPLALQAANERGETGAHNREWRVHFHVPLHSLPAGQFQNTSDHLLGTLDWLAHDPARCSHLEMETYTWEVLPEGLKAASVVDQLALEYEWILPHLRERGLAEEG